MQWGIRELLLGLFGIVWAVLVIIVVWRTKDLVEIPNGLLASLGVGIGAIMAAFRVDEYASMRNENGRYKRSAPEAVEDSTK